MWYRKTGLFWQGYFWQGLSSWYLWVSVHIYTVHAPLFIQQGHSLEVMGHSSALSRYAGSSLCEHRHVLLFLSLDWLYSENDASQLLFLTVKPLFFCLLLMFGVVSKCCQLLYVILTGQGDESTTKPNFHCSGCAEASYGPSGKVLSCCRRAKQERTSISRLDCGSVSKLCQAWSDLLLNDWQFCTHLVLQSHRRVKMSYFWHDMTWHWPFPKLALALMWRCWNLCVASLRVLACC